MLDVHAPEHRLEGFRDFAVHLLTITAGLLIALGLENAAEAWHHRHQRKEAEANIRAEIRENSQKVHDAAQGVIDERDIMANLLRICEARSDNKPGSLQGVKLAFAESPLRDAAWRTANSTGVLAYMEYGEAERFADAYKEQDLLQATEERALEHYLELEPVLSHHGEELTPEAARDAIPYIRKTLADLEGMLAIGVGTIGAYKNVLDQGTSD